MTEVKTQFGHEHQFTFLRQEKEASKHWGDRVLEWTFYDVFFCQGCLEYQRVKVRTVGRDSQAWYEVPS